MLRPTRVLACALLTVASLVPTALGADELGTPSPPAGAERALVVDVTDGDTIRVDRGGVVERLRYIGIDAPETVHPDEPVGAWGPQASAANEALVAGRVVLLERDVSERDRYDRLLRYVWVEGSDGWRMVNAELVAQGLAEVRAYPPDTKHDAWLRTIEAEARAAGLGIHGSDPGERECVGSVVGTVCSPSAIPSRPPGESEGNLLDDLLDLLFGEG